MRKISAWAKAHPWTTRFIIVINYILLNVIGVFAGNLFSDLGVVFPASILFINALVCIAAFFFYPAKENKAQYKNFYRTQKTTDLILLVTTFVFIVCGTTQLNNAGGSHANGLYAATVVVPVKPVEKMNNTTSVNESKPMSAKPALSKKGLRKKLKENLKELRRLYKESSDGEKVALIVLSVLVALGLLFLLAALACNLSCSGSDAAAILVGILGTGLIVFLFVRVVQRITKGPRKKKTETTPPETKQG